MSELDDERRQLETADRHLGEGAERIAHQKALVNAMKAGPDQRRAQELLDLLEATLEQWRGHRQAIIERIGLLAAEEAAAHRVP
jgi:hypothetical protein